MKPKTLLVLSLLTLALGLFIAFYEKDLPSTHERLDAEKKVVPVETEAVTAIELSSAGGDRILLEKDQAPAEQDPLSSPPDVWRLSSPIQARADADALTDLLSRLASIEKSRTLENPDLSQLGLEQPELSVILQTEGGPKELHVGSELPLSGDRALLGNARDVAFQATVDPELLIMLNREASDWRDKRLFVEPRNAIEALTLTRGDVEIRLQRFGDGEKYRLVAPIADAADADKVRGLLTTLVGLQAEAFLDSDAAPADLGLQPAQGSLEVSLAEGSQPWRLELGLPRTDLPRADLPRTDLPGTDDPERLWARFSSSKEQQIVEIRSSELLAALDSAVDEWRSRDWSTLQVFGIQKAKFAGPGETFEIERKDGGEWSRGNDRIEYSVASDALYPFTEIKAVALTPRQQAEQRFDLSQPRLTATLSDGEREEVLHLYPGDAEFAAAALEGRNAVLWIDSTAADELVEKIEALRNAPTVAEDLQP